MGKRCKGSITVFLSLMLVIVLTVTSVCLESAHQEAVGAQLAMKSEEAGMNLFSHFEKALYDKYDVLALNNRLDLNGILKNSLGQTTGQEDTVFHLNYQLKQVSLENTRYLGDENGKGFQSEVNEIITEEAVIKIKKKITEYLQAAKESEEVVQQLNLVSNEQETISSLVDKLSEISEGCKNLNKVALTAKNQLQSYYDSAKSYQIGDMTFAYETLEIRTQLDFNEERLRTMVSGLLQRIHEYKQLALELSVKLKSANEALKDDSLSKENKDLLLEQIESIQDLTESKGESYKKVIALEEELQKDKVILEEALYPGLDTLMAALKEGKDCTYLFGSGFQLLEKLEKCKIPGEKQGAGTQDSSNVKKLLKTVNAIIKSGPYGYIVGDQEKLSKRSVDTKELPTITYKKNSNEDTANLFRRVLVDTTEAFTLNCYLTEYMACYTDGKQYDLEYILGGKNSDRDNLKVVVNQLVLARTSLNLVYLLKDKAKREEAELAATALTACFGMVALEKAASYVILSAWAYAEAVLDVKSLIEGGKVAFFKTSKNWRLSLSSAGEVDSELKKTKGGKEGLTYKEYLRIMLFFHSRVRNLYRGLDMIQWNLCETDSEFRISQCIYETGFQVQASAPFIFLSDSYQGNLLSGVNQLSLSKKVGYCSIERSKA